jgi:hypothetical protein
LKLDNFSASIYKTELEKNKVISIIPTGNSMWPTLKNRGQSVIVELKKQRLEKFDVALYHRPNDTVVLHRVMEVKDGGYVMCGDSQFNLEWVEEEQVFAKMIGFYKGDKYVSVADHKYIKKVEKWYRRKGLRRLRIKCFYLKLNLKLKVKSLFCKKEGR